MIDSLPKNECTGCNACVDVCPTKAIELETDIEGFWYPIIDKNKCTECGLCDKACPVLNISELKINDFEKPKCYAAVHKNLEVRFDSTSGGLFSALAEKMYRDGGSVGGAIYNDDFSVKHILTKYKKDLKDLRSSKYLQSDTTGLFNDIKALLKNDEKVLVCGTPCQMAGVRSFLGKNYENLILIDFVCRGINTPKVFRKYLDSLEEKYNSKVVYIKAKSKELGWRKLTTKFIFENGATLFDTKDTSLFTKGYLHTNAYCRPSCYDCKFKGFPRIADITLADFWGIEEVDKDLDNDLGTSMVLINSQKGEKYFEGVDSKISYKEVPFDTILHGNPAIYKSLNRPKVDRKVFFQELDQYSFFEVAQRYFPKDSIKHKAKDFAKNIFIIFKHSQGRLKPLLQFFLKNNFKSGFLDSLKKGKFLFVAPYCVIEIHKGAKLNINGRLKLGGKKFKRSKLETRLLVESKGKLTVNGNFNFFYGADIEVFSGGELIIEGGNGGTNINLTIICAHKILIGKGVQIGRGVTIRDNNGGHFIARQGYKDKRPVIIGDRVWLGEGATIMPGVKIGDGAIVGANSLVITNVPANTIVSGNPAKVVDVDVLWKY